jgi:hypothetical protein
MGCESAGPEQRRGKRDDSTKIAAVYSFEKKNQDNLCKKCHLKEL